MKLIFDGGEAVLAGLRAELEAETAAMERELRSLRNGKEEAIAESAALEAEKSRSPLRAAEIESMIARTAERVRILDISIVAAEEDISAAKASLLAGR